MLNHKRTVNISTERLLLRRFKTDDAEKMHNNWANDSEVCKYLKWQPHKDVNETKTILNKWIESYKKIYNYHWAITVKESYEIVGSISIFVDDEDSVNCGLGYCIGKNYWGNGIMTEVLKAVLKFAFMEVGFNKIEAYHSSRNQASGRVMQKSFMLFDGLIKNKYKSNSGIEDSYCYSIEKMDYLMIQSAIDCINKNYDDKKYNHTVGSAVRCKNGKIYNGVNCDGIHGSCAEFISIGSAVTAGEREFECIVAYSQRENKILSPCGNCRQMLYEYSPDVNVIVENEKQALIKVNIKKLLPYPCY